MRDAIKVIGQLADVAGNHSRFFFTMEPLSFLARMTDQSVANFDLYGWTPQGTMPELNRMLPSKRGKALNAKEFVLAGKIVDYMEEQEPSKLEALEAEGLRAFKDQQEALAFIAQTVLPEEK